MKTDYEVRRLFSYMDKSKTLKALADRAEMYEQTARKYINSRHLPSELKKEHTWRTRVDFFEKDWKEVVVPFLENNEGLEAKTLFEYLQREFPGKYQDGQLRTLQRRIKTWRALEGSPKEVMFPQIHYPGILSQSDYTHMDELGITISGTPFRHLVYHFVLTYSNWETGTICFSESFESLSLGLQNALWELDGVSEQHQTDSLSAAVKNTDPNRGFTRAYDELLNYYNLEGRKIQPRSPNENGDVEKSHDLFKRAVDQRLMLRGSRDFESREEYEGFLKKLFTERNQGRLEKFYEEKKLLKKLPAIRQDSHKEFTVSVTKNSTIRVQHNTYSVPSQLIKETVKIYLFADYLELCYAQKLVETIPRLRGEGKHYIQYRHIIDSLIKKSGAFENYKYREDMFPSTYFRMAYDQLLKQHTYKKATREYLQILFLAAKEGEVDVEYALKSNIDAGLGISCADVKDVIKFQKNDHKQLKTNINIAPVDLNSYDELVFGKENDC